MLCNSSPFRLSAALLFFNLTLTLPASAQEAASSAAARALFSEGRKLVEQGQYQAACPKFEESLRLRPGSGTRFNLADCWENIGRTASAWAEFLEVATAARNAGQKDREAIARARAQALEPKLARLVIEADPSTANARLLRNGTPIGAGALGAAVPVDPGTHRIEAIGERGQTWSATVQVKAGETARIAIPKLEEPAADGQATSASSPARSSAGAPPARAAAASSETTRDTRSGWGAQRGLALGLGGLGVAGLAVGTVFLLRYESTNDDAKALCPTDVCANQDELDRHAALLDDAKGHRTVSAIGFGVGGAALIAGTIVFLTAPSASKERVQSSWSLEPLAGRRTSGVALRGRW